MTEMIRNCLGGSSTGSKLGSEGGSLQVSPSAVMCLGGS